MPIDFAVLATTLVSSFLVPYAKKGLAKIQEEVSETAGNAVAAGVEKVWKKTKALFTSEKEKIQFEELEQHPDDGAGTVRRVLEEKLRAAPEVAAELDQLVKAPVPGVAGNTTLQNIMADTFGYVNAQGANISGQAQVAGVVVGGIRAKPTGGESSTSRPGTQRP